MSRVQNDSPFPGQKANQTAMKNPRLLAIGAAATVVAGLLFGGAVSAGASANPVNTFTSSIGLTRARVSSEDRAAAREAYLQSLADNLGVDLATLKAALSTTSFAALEQAVTDGKITEEEAATIREKIESGENVIFGLDGGPGGHHGPAGHGHGGGAVKGASAEEIAAFLGTEEETLRTELQSGKSLATIAGELGFSRDELTAFLTGEITASLAEKVAAGDLTQEEADEKLADAVAALDERIDGTFTGMGPGMHGGPRHGGTNGMDDSQD